MNSNKDNDTNLDFDSLMFDERFENGPEASEPEPFEAEHIPALRDKLVHLSRFGNLLTLVLGERGSGKTFLLEQLLAEVNEESDVCRIQAQPLFTTDQLYQTLQSEFLSATSSALDNDQFQRHLSELELPVLNRVLVIDDADTLSVDVVQELCALSAAEQEKDSPFVKVILFANHDLTISIESAATGILPDTGIYTIDIPELNDEDAKRWVELILLNEDYHAHTEDVEEILNLGGRNLMTLEEVALDFIDSVPAEDILEDEGHDEQPGVSMMGYWFAGLTLIILLVLGGFFYQDEITELIFPPEPNVAIKDTVIDVSKPIVEAEQPVIDPVQDEKGITSVDSTEGADNAEINEPAVVETIANSNGEVSAPTTDDIDAKGSDSVVEEQQTLAEETAENVAEDSRVTEQQQVSNTDAEQPITQAETDQPVEAAPTPVTENANPIQQDQEIYTVSEQRLLNAGESAYVVQIVGLSNPDSVSRLLQDNQDLDLMAYRSLLNGRPWQVVVLGVFDNYADANLERNSLPESLAVNKPWIKSVAKVQEEIRSAVNPAE